MNSSDKIAAIFAPSPDVLVEACLLVELKAVREIAPIHEAQLISYMKLMDIPLGLLTLPE